MESEFCALTSPCCASHGSDASTPVSVYCGAPACSRLLRAVPRPSEPLGAPHFPEPQSSTSRGCQPPLGAALLPSLREPRAGLFHGLLLQAVLVPVF